MIKPTKEQVNAIDLSPLIDRLSSQGKDYFNGEAGKEHYKLLAFIASEHNNVRIVEIGTRFGLGALALSVNQKNKVTTYDIEIDPNEIDLPKNVKRKLVSDKSYSKDILSSQIIFYDAAHDGIQETAFINELVKRGWKGLLIWDDIYVNDEMKAFWHNITHRKEDWSDIGHHSGTGLTWIE
jgi:predicted O-methyltransferase YrrM